MLFNNHLKSHESLITPHGEIRAGFIYLALEKNKKATPAKGLWRLKLLIARSQN